MANNLAFSNQSSTRTRKGIVRRSLVYSLIITLAFPWTAYAELPQPCGAGSCGGANFIESGSVEVLNAGAINPAINVGNALTINQESSKAFLNWESFNVSEGSSVTFNQVSNSAVALNKIHDASPSQILGNLSANGSIYLLNGAGVIFGENAQINIGSLVATSLDIDKEVFENSSINARFIGVTADDSGNTDLAGLFKGDDSQDDAAVVNHGTIVAEKNGNVLLAAPEVINEGSITTEDGQVVMAGVKDRLYIIPSTSSELRGFLVEIGGDGGSVTNEEAAEIFAERGNITLLASEIHQKGTLKSSTDTNWSGSIFLLGRDHADNYLVNSSRLLDFRPESSSADGAGDLDNTVTLYENSITEIELELDTAQATIDAVEQLESRIDIEGGTVDLRNGASISAKSGNLNIGAVDTGVVRLNTFGEIVFQLSSSADRPDSLKEHRVFIDEGVNIDLSGADTVKSVSDNLIEVELFSNELKDSPEQRDGALRGQTIVVDVRDGTPIADVDSAIENINKPLSERAGSGGSVNIISDGDVVFNSGATIDISGGKISYEDGYTNTSKLLSDGRIIDIADAAKEEQYDGVLTSGLFAQYERGYEEGLDAGQVRIAGHGMLIQGDIVAETTSGAFQQDASEAAKKGTLVVGLNDSDVRGGLGTIEPDFRASSIMLSDFSLSELGSESLIGLTDDLTEEQILTSNISTDYIQSGVGVFDFTSNGRISLGNATLGSGGVLDLGHGISITANAPSVTVNQSIALASGTLDLKAGDGTFGNAYQRLYFADPLDSSSDPLRPDAPDVPELVIADEITIDMSGQWSNDYKDFLSAGVVGTTPLSIDGGNISLEALDLQIGENVAINVSASGHVHEGGNVEYGTGGSVSISANATGAELSLGNGFSVDGTSFADAGEFFLGAQSLIFSDSIVNNGGNSLVQVAENSGSPVVVVASELLENSGFSSFAFQQGSIRDFEFNGAEVDGDLVFLSDFSANNLVQKNWVFPLVNGSPQLAQVGDASLEPGTLDIREITSQSQIDEIVSKGYLADINRSATELSATLGNRSDNAEFRKDIVVEEGVQINLESDSDSRFALTNVTAGRILLDGEVTVHGGEIDIELSRFRQQPFSNDSYVALGENTRLDVSGVFQRDFSQRRGVTGDLLDGGVINIASSGYVIADENSFLDASGASVEQSTLGLATVESDAMDATFENTSRGGTINIASNEGSVLAGGMDLSGGDEKQFGGDLNLISRVVVNGPLIDTLQPPEVPDIVQITSSSLSENRVDDRQNGITQITVSAIENSGLDNLNIQASELELEAGIDLDIGGTFKAEVGKLGVLESDIANSVSVDAGYFALGDISFIPREVPVDGFESHQGENILTVNAGLVDLSGQVAIEDFNDVTFLSRSDLRLRQGRDIVLPDELDAGRLSMSGELNLVADRVLPVTNTNFDIYVSDFVGAESSSAGRISISGVSDTNVSPVLSANSNLSFNAQSIFVDTKVAAPYGTINMNARSVTFDDLGQPSLGDLGRFELAENGVLSVSAEGQFIPYGFTVNSRDWYYDLHSEVNLADSPQIVTSEGINVPNSEINIEGSAVELAEGSAINIANSGDLFATEFVPGTGGSTDYLLGENRYAILPNFDNGYASFDQRYSEGFNLELGTQIVLEGTNSLPAGTYTLFPAEYAHLDGAYIVSIETGVNAIAPGQNRKLLDGTPLNAAYLQNGFSGSSNDEYLAVSVRQGGDANRFSEYQISNLKDFVVDAEAKHGLTSLVGVNDAGRVGIRVTESLDLGGSLFASADDGGTEGRFDISAEDLLVGNASDTRVLDDGYVHISPEQLSTLSEGSILLGGNRTRTIDQDGDIVTQLEGTADNVVIAANSSIQASELILLAQNELSVEQGAQIQSANEISDSNNHFSIQNGAAVLGVSRGRIGQVDRFDVSSDKGSINVSEEAQVAGNSILVEAGEQFEIFGTIESRGGDAIFGAERILLNASDDGSILNNNLLASIEQSASLSLRSEDALIMGANLDLTANELEINSSGIELLLSGTDATLTANSLAITNRGEAADLLGEDLTGNFELVLNETYLEGAAFTIAGGETVFWGSRQGVFISESNNLSFEGQATVQIDSPLVSLASGSESNVNVSGDLSLVDTGNAPANVDANSVNLGGKIRISAADILVDSNIRSNSGVIDLQANADFTLGENGALDVSGVEFSIVNENFGTDGGRVSISAAENLNLISTGQIDVGTELQDTTSGILELVSADGELNIGAVITATNRGSEEFNGGSLMIDTSTFSETSNMSGALTLLNQQGFDDQIAVRVRGEEMVSLAAESEIVANSILISSDSALEVAGSITAGKQTDGDVRLLANDALSLTNTASIGETGVGDREVRVELSSMNGALSFDEGSSITLGENDLVQLVANRLEGGLRIDGHLAQALQTVSSDVRILGIESVDLISTDLVNSDVSNAILRSRDWLDDETLILESIGLVGAEGVELAPGTVFNSAGEVTILANNIDFANEVFGDDLTTRHGLFAVRAGGDLIVDASISDGFGVAANGLDEKIASAQAASSFSLVAGADLTSANLLDTQNSNGDDEIPELVLEANHHIRTSDGDINLTSAGNIRLADKTSAVYVAGKDSGWALDNNDLDLVEVPYVVDRATPTEGGDLSLVAGGDIIGGASANESSQLYAEWFKTQQALDPEVQISFFPVFSESIVSPSVNAGMFIDYSEFRQGFAAIGGGDLNIEAKGDLVRVGASVPTTIHYQPGTEGEAGVETRFGEGNLNVSVLGDIYSSDFLVGDGSGLIKTESSVLNDRIILNDRASSTFALMGGDLSVQSLSDQEIALVLDPGMLDLFPTGRDRARDDGAGQFITQSGESSIDFTSVAGNLDFGSKFNIFNSLPSQDMRPSNSANPGLPGINSLSVPAQLNFAAYTGDLTVGAVSNSMGIGLLPSEDASLSLVAGNDLVVDLVVDFIRNSPDDLPSVAAQIDEPTSKNGRFFIRSEPILTSALRSESDSTPSRIIAGGDISLRPTAIDIAEQTDIRAGSNIELLGNLDIYHNKANDVSSLIAGNNIDLNADENRGVVVVGPGRFNVAAGNDINLGVSRGFEAAAGLVNSFYAQYDGVDMTFLAGATLDDLDFDTFLDDYLDSQSTLTEDFVRFIELVDESVDGEVSRLNDAVIEFAALTEQERSEIEASLDLNLSIEQFTLYAMLADSSTEMMLKPYYSDRVFDLLSTTESGQAQLQAAMSAFTALPADDFEGDVLPLYSGLNFSDKSELTSLAYRALSEEQKLSLASQLINDIGEDDKISLGLASMFSSLANSGVLANTVGTAAYDQGFESLATVFPGIVYNGDLDSESSYSGNIDVFFSKIYSFEGGDINILTPGGRVNGGVVQSPSGTPKASSELGVVVQQQGDINAFMQDSYLVNQSRAFTLQRGNILMWASEGNIDAGKGAKTAVAIPPPVIEQDSNGNLVVKSSSAIAGSGIRQFDSLAGECDAFCQVAEALDLPELDSSVNLIAPKGEVNAGDAGIGSAGDINIAAARVVGADNIDVGGVAVGVPVDGGGLSAGLSGLGALASAASNAAADTTSAAAAQNSNGFGDEALAWLEVFVLGYGEEEEAL